MWFIGTKPTNYTFPGLFSERDVHLIRDYCSACGYPHCHWNVHDSHSQAHTDRFSSTMLQRSVFDHHDVIMTVLFFHS